MVGWVPWKEVLLQEATNLVQVGEEVLLVLSQDLVLDLKLETRKQKSKRIKVKILGLLLNF